MFNTYFYVFKDIWYKFVKEIESVKILSNWSSDLDFVLVCVCYLLEDVV